MLMSLKGATGILKLYEDRIVITSTKSTKKNRSDKTIYLKTITGVQLKLGSSFSAGYIHFNLPGSRDKFIFEEFSAAYNDNAVVFSKKENDTATQIKNKIEELISTAPSDSNESIDDIRKYKALLDEGIISQAEFEAKKKQLLGL